MWEPEGFQTVSGKNPDGFRTDSGWLPDGAGRCWEPHRPTDTHRIFYTARGGEPKYFNKQRKTIAFVFQNPWKNHPEI